MDLKYTIFVTLEKQEHLIDSILSGPVLTTHLC